MSEERSLALALGLTHDPFATPSDTFFAAGDRTRQLDELRQFSRGRRRLLAVTGDWGVGKSVMFRALSNRLDPGVKAARINASLVNDEIGVLSNVVQGLGLGAPSRDRPDALAKVIVDHARAQDDANRYCLIMVDDAHALELRALETLLEMVEATPGHGLRLVFFAETRFVQSLEKAIVRAAPGLSWHEIRLTPFSRDEVRSYLRFRFEEAGWTDNLPFTELQVQELTVDSGGYPGEINQRAGRLLSGDGAKASTGLFPPMHRAVLMLVGAVVGMIWLVWQFGELTGGTDDQAVLDRIARGNQRIEQELARGADSIPESEPTSLEPDPEPAPVQDFWRESGSESELDEHAEAGAHQVPDPEPASEPGADRDPVPAAVSQRETEPAPAPAPEPAPTPEARLPEPEPEPEPAPVPPPQAETRTEPSVDPRDRFDEYEPAGPTLRPGARGAGWLMRQAPERYTLQLFGTSNLDRMVAYVNRQQDISEFAMLTLERDGEPWYVVTYGLFSTAGAARTAAEKLPSSAGRVDPWVRKVGSVQAHIQQAR